MEPCCLGRSFQRSENLHKHMPATHPHHLQRSWHPSSSGYAAPHLLQVRPRVHRRCDGHRHRGARNLDLLHQLRQQDTLSHAFLWLRSSLPHKSKSTRMRVEPPAKSSFDQVHVASTASEPNLAKTPFLCTTSTRLVF